MPRRDELGADPLQGPIGELFRSSRGATDDRPDVVVRQALETRQNQDSCLIRGQRRERPRERARRLARRNDSLRRLIVGGSFAARLGLDLTSLPPPERFHNLRASSAAKGVVYEVVQNGKEPRSKGPLRIVRVSSAMEPKKRLLLEILSGHDVSQSPHEKAIHAA